MCRRGGNRLSEKIRRRKCQVPATKYEASLLRIASAASWMARSSASRIARCSAKRCSEPGASASTCAKVEVLENDFAGRDFNELITRPDAVDLRGRTSAGDVDHHRGLQFPQSNHEAVRGGVRAGAAVQVELQCIVHADGQSRLRRSLPRRDRRDVDLGELVVHAVAADRRLAAVKRLETAGRQAGSGQHDGEPRDAKHCVMVTPPH